MSVLYVNTITPNSGDIVTVSGSLTKEPHSFFCNSSIPSFCLLAKNSVCLTDRPFLTTNLDKEIGSLEFNIALACPELIYPFLNLLSYFLIIILI